MKLPYRILVLDDDENALSGIVELLRDADYRVTGAATYDAAKQLLTANAFDLLICDVRLRGISKRAGIRRPSSGNRSAHQPSSPRSRTVSRMCAASAAGRASVSSAASG
jgi:CheY-like chemotaxis protein